MATINLTQLKKEKEASKKASSSFNNAPTIVLDGNGKSKVEESGKNTSNTNYDFSDRTVTPVQRKTQQNVQPSQQNPVVTAPQTTTVNQQINRPAQQDQYGFWDNAGYVVEQAGKGLQGGIGGLVNAASTFLDKPFQTVNALGSFGSKFSASNDYSQYDPATAEALRQKDAEIEQLRRQMYGNLDENFLDEFAQKGTELGAGMIAESQESNYDRDKLSGVGRFTGDVAKAVTGMAPSLAVGAVAGPGAGLAVMGTGAYGQSLQQALNDGASYEDAVVYGLASAGVEIATEKLFGGIPFFGDGAVDDVLKEWMQAKLGQGTGKAVVKYVMDSVGEGAEEYIAEVAGEFLVDIYTDERKDKDFFDRLMDVQDDAFYSFLLGAATGGVMGAPGTILQSIKSGDTQKKPTEKDPIKSMINEDAKAEAQKIVADMGQSTPVNNYVAEGLKSDNVAVKMEAQKKNAENIRKSAKKLNIDKQVEEIIQVSNKLGKTIEFTEDLVDQKAWGANTGDKIILSKKSGDMIQQIFVHELTHDAENSQLYSELETELSNLAAVNGVDVTALTEQIIRDYAEQGVSLDDVGARAEVNARIAQEYLFKESGIKQLANTNLSLAQKVFNWVRSLRIKLSGTEAEKQLLKTEQLYKKAIESARKKPAKKQYMFGGEFAKNADLTTLERAKQMESENIDKDTIWKETGWVKKADGKWRFEISDRETVYSFYELKELGETTLGRIMFNDKLYENYPFLEDIPVVMDDMLDDNVAGAYSAVFGTIKLNDHISEDKLITTLLHEVQHAIQQYEDFQSGTNLKDARTEVIKKVDEKIASFEKKNPGFKKLFDEYDDLADGYSDALGAVGTAEESEIIEAVTDGKFDNFADYERALFKMRKNIWDKYGKTSMQDYRKILEENNYRNYLEEYQNNLGEVEARDTQARRKMSAEERRQNLPKTEGYVTDSKGNSYSINDINTIKKISSNALNADGTIKTISNQIRDIIDGKVKVSDHLFCGKTPSGYADFGLDTNKLLAMRQSVVRKKFRKHSELTPEIVDTIVNSPDKVMFGIQRNNGTIAFFYDIQTEDGKFFEMVVNPNGSMHDNEIIINEINTIYGRENLNELLIDEKNHGSKLITNKKSSRYLSNAQSNMGGLSKATFNNSISDSSKNSNKQYSISNEILKRKQLEIIQNSNPMIDDYHVGIRSVDDIKTFEEAMQDDESFVWGDFSLEDAQDALDQGKVMVYSSKPMNQGDFVSTSYNQARDYAGGGKVYSKVMKLSDIAWINGDEGQIAQVTKENDDIRYAINSNILERAKDPAVRARAQMEKRIRHTFLFNKKSNPLKMYDVTSRIEDEFERTGKISDDLRKELFTTAYEETLRSSDVSYKELPEFKQMLQEDLNRAVSQYENTLIKERELKKFAEENDIDVSEVRLNPTTGFLKNVKPQDLPDKIISYKKLKASLKSDLINQVDNYAGGKVIDELIDKAAIEIVEDGFISSPTKFEIRQEMIKNGYSINAEAMNDNKELYDFIKSTKFNVPRGFGREIQDFDRTKKLLKTSTQDGQPIDTVYKELRSRFGEFFPDDLTNPADQYQQIADVMAEMEPTRLMLEDSEQYNAEMRQYLEDNFTDRLEDFKNQVLYRSQKDYYDRAAKKQVAYDEAMNQVSEKISEKFFKENKDIDELQKSEHVIKSASIEDLSEVIAKIQDRGALSKTLAQNLDAMANGDVMLRAKLSEIFEKPLREAKKTYVTNQKRVLNDVYKRIVTDLGIKMGSKESAAMMWYGEGQKQLNKVKGKVESDKLEFTKYTLDDLKKDFPKTWQNIVEADKIMRKYYDEYVDRINESLEKVYSESVLKESVNEKRTQLQKDIREAQERLEQLKAQRTGEVGGPDLEARINAQRKRITDLSRQFNNVAQDVYRNKRLNKRPDYYHHFQEIGFAENIQQILNVDNANNIANALAGISEYTKPKSKWEKFMQRRSNVARYEEDAIKGFLKYSPAAEYKISFDPYVAQMRGTIQDMIKLSDEANLNNAKAINWLTNYTNSLAGKTNPMDRWLAHTESGRTVLQLLNKVNSRVKANAVVGNLNSAVSQFYNLPNGLAVLTDAGGAQSALDVAKGSADYSAYAAKKISGQDISDNPINQSVFLSERYIDSTIEQFDESIMHKPEKAAKFLLTFGDQVVAEQLWFSAYEQGMRLGKHDPVAYADDLVSRSVAGRGIGEVPLMQQSQVVKLIAPFQVEVNNAYQLMKQLGAGALKDKEKLLSLAIMYGITWIMNEVNEALTGNRVGMDIFNAMQDAVTNWDTSKNPVTNTFNAAGRLTGEILSNVPMGAQFAQMVVSDEYDREKLFGESDPSRYGTGNIGVNALMDPAVQLVTGQNVDWQSLVTNFATPMGGKQLNRFYKMAEDIGLIPRVDISTEQGLQASWKPGAYNDKGQLKYQIDTSDPLNVMKGFAFGTYATNEGKNYLDNEYSALSAKKTTLYETAVESGADPVEFYNALREANYSRNLVDKNGESIDNSKAAMNREALERNNSFDEVKKLIESGQAEASDFGLTKTVFEWTQEEFNKFMKSLDK